MEKKRVQQRGAFSQVRVGGQDEFKGRHFSKKGDLYQNPPGSQSPNGRFRRGGGRFPSRNPRREQKQNAAANVDKISNPMVPGVDLQKSEEVNELEDGDKNPQGPQNMKQNEFQKLRHVSNRQYGQQGAKNRRLWQNYGRHQVYNKESYLQANCRFVVQDSGDYALHSVDPDTLVDWNLIEQIYLFSHDTPSCPICLENPRVARITRCGHVYCWPCILHYLQLSEKPWRKCPICYEAVIPADLKSVVTSSTRKFVNGETIKMQLMQRKKGSMLPKPFASRANSESRVIEWKGDMRSVIQSVHAKLLKASPKIVYEKIVSPEMRELEEQLREAKSEQSGEECFIESAIHLLKEREKELVQCMHNKELIVERKEAKEVPSEVNKSPKIMDLLKDKMASVDLDDPAFSDEEQDEKIESGNAKEAAESDAPKQVPKDAPPPQEICGNASSSATSDYYYYYQAIDGQNIYLHPVNIRCLITEYGSMQSSPDTITAQIIDMESFSMTVELRKRFRYLSHLPLACEFTFCELMIRPPILSRETLARFADEFYQRKVARQQKKRQERKFQRKIENKMTIDSFGREIDQPTEVASLDLQSLEDFPSQIGPSSPESAPVTAGTSVAWGSSSFANALQRAPQPAVRKREIPRPRTVSDSSSQNVGNSDDIMDEDYVPVPSFAYSFSDALNSAFEKQSIGKNGEGPKGKKKQKGKKLLFTTISAPKYS